MPGDVQPSQRERQRNRTRLDREGADTIPEPESPEQNRDICPTCKGTGWEPATDMGEATEEPCATCDGDGILDLAADLESIHAAVTAANIDPSRDILAEMTKRGRP